MYLDFKDGSCLDFRPTISEKRMSTFDEEALEVESQESSSELALKELNEIYNQDMENLISEEVSYRENTDGAFDDPSN